MVPLLEIEAEDLVLGDNAYKVGVKYRKHRTKINTCLEPCCFGPIQVGNSYKVGVK